MENLTDAQAQALLNVEVSNLHSLHQKLETRLGKFGLEQSGYCSCGGRINLVKEGGWQLTHVDPAGDSVLLTKASLPILVHVALEVRGMIHDLRRLVAHSIPEAREARARLERAHEMLDQP